MRSTLEDVHNEECKALEMDGSRWQRPYGAQWSKPAKSRDGNA